MRKIILASAAMLLVTSAAALAAPSTSRPVDAAFCAMTSGEREATNCGFQTLNQCQAFVSGQNGTCTENSALWTNSQARYISRAVRG